MKKIPALFVLFVFPILVYSQVSEADEKAFNVAIETFNKGQQDKGITEARKVLDKNQGVTDLWDIMVKMYNRRYLTAKENFNDKMNSSLADMLSEGNGKKKKKKNSVDDMMQSLTPYLSAQSSYETFLREATLKSKSTTASMYLRIQKVDGAKPDSLIGSDARKDFNQAETYFSNEAYENAIQYYRTAIAKADGYYFDAQLYLGDAYYMLAQYDSAEKYFKECAVKFPQYIEPHKFLADSYSKSYDFENAVESCINAIKIYPDWVMFYRLEEAAKMLRKTYNDGWMIRGTYPYKAKDADAYTAPAPWNDYISASQKAWEASDSLGVINNPSDFEGEKYAEVYAWKKMLEKGAGRLPTFAFANEMNRKGYLDCYVFITLFHYDLYPTYKHFIANNPDRAAEYLRNVVIYK